MINKKCNLKIDSDPIKRIKFLFLETWASNDLWYQYALDYNKKNIKNIIEIYHDRSPCRDPYIDKNKTFISGLCRKKNIAKKHDFIIYYTRPCKQWLKSRCIRNGKYIIFTNGLYINESYESHYKFYEENNCYKSNLLPNIFNISNTDAYSRNFDEGVYSGINKIIDPYDYYKSICYKKKGENKYEALIQSESGISSDIYKKQINIYYKLISNKNLKVFECKNIPFKTGLNNQLIDISNISLIFKGVDIFKKCHGNRIVYDVDKNKDELAINSVAAINYLNNIFSSHITAR